jgi:predicted transcriptional regulator of viral defense system
METIQKMRKFSNRGYFSLKQCLEHGVSRYDLKNLEDSGKIKKVNYGLYAFANVVEDEYYIPQVLSDKVVYSNETALYLTGYSDLLPEIFTVTVPKGYHSKKMWQNFLVRQTPAELLNEGVQEIQSFYSNPLKVYCIERTLCELLHSRKDFNKERYIPALQRYMASKDRKIWKLTDYARMFNVENKIRPYLEVLI